MFQTENHSLVLLDVMSKSREKDNEIERLVQENRALKQTVIDNNAKLRESEIRFVYEKTTNRRLQSYIKRQEEKLKIQYQKNEIHQVQRDEFNYEDKEIQTKAEDNEIVSNFETKLEIVNKKLNGAT